jgi:hypothetical protein
MPPQTNSVVNMYTVDPDILCREPIYVYNGLPADNHILRLKGVGGPEGNACFLFYGKVGHSFLQHPATAHIGANIAYRGIFITSYKANLKRLQQVIAHFAGKREDFVLPYGSCQLALTQTPKLTNMSDNEGVDIAGMKHPLYWQDASSPESFNFKFPAQIPFDQKRKYDSFLLLRVFTYFSDIYSTDLRWDCSFHGRWKRGEERI